MGFRITAHATCPCLAPHCSYCGIYFAQPCLVAARHVDVPGFFLFFSPSVFCAVGIVVERWLFLQAKRYCGRNVLRRYLRDGTVSVMTIASVLFGRQNLTVGKSSCARLRCHAFTRGIDQRTVMILRHIGAIIIAKCF